MATHDYVIDNQSALAFRADLNNVLQAIVSQNSSATAPTTPYADMIWYDTAANQLKKRNEANSAWIVLGTIDEGLGTFTPSGVPAIATLVEAQTGTDNTKMMTPLRVSDAITALASKVNYQAFTASGTWTKPANLSADAIVYVELIGGGGGGGARVRGSGSAGISTGGAGGGFITKIALASSLGATVAVTVGGGGSGVTASSNTSVAGGTGGTSSFGSFSVAGGSGGTASGATTLPTGNATSHGFDGFQGGDSAWDTTATLMNSIHGGAAGGTAAFGAVSVSPGTSRFAGNGGAAVGGNVAGQVGPAGAGSAPGGGGGGANNATTSPGTAVSGAGARGEVRVWTIG